MDINNRLKICWGYASISEPSTAYTQTTKDVVVPIALSGAWASWITAPLVANSHWGQNLLACQRISTTTIRLSAYKFVSTPDLIGITARYLCIGF